MFFILINFYFKHFRLKIKFSLCFYFLFFNLNAPKCCDYALIYRELFSLNVIDAQPFMTCGLSHHKGSAPITFDKIERVRLQLTNVFIT